MGSRETMSDSWAIWRAVSAGVAFALATVLLTRHVLGLHLSDRARRTLDLLSAPLFALFAVYIATDFLRPVP